MSVLLDPAAWRGPDGLAHHLLVHLGVAGLALGLACALALPAAVAVGHRRPGAAARRRLGTGVTVATTTARAVPVLALASVLLLVAAPQGAGSAPLAVVVPAVAVLCAPPLFACVVAAFGVVETATVEALRAAGASEAQVLRDVELVLAAPAVVAGVRRAAARAVGGTAVAGIVGGPGLGAGIAQGLVAGDPVRYLPPAVVLALAGLLVAAVLTLAQRSADPHRRGERARPRRTPVAVPSLLPALPTDVRDD